MWGRERRDRVRQVIVHGPDGKRTLAPGVNGSFLVAYGPNVQPSQLRVELVPRDGRRLTFQHSTGLITPRKWYR